MNLKEENKVLRRELFEARFGRDIAEFRIENDYEYKAMVNSCVESLLDCYQEHVKKLIPIIGRYSFETVNNYFVSEHKKLPVEKDKPVDTDKDNSETKEVDNND